MSDNDFKPGDTVKAFSPNIPGVEKFEWVKKPTHIPQPRPITLYGIEVVEADGNPMPFIAHSKPFRDLLN